MYVPRLRATGMALLAAAVAAVILSAAATAAPNKPYSIVICGGGQTGCTSSNPAVIAPGGNADQFHPPSSLSVTFTNDNKLGSGIQLGSDNLNVPSTLAGFSVISVSLQEGNAAGECPPTFNNSAPPCFVLLNNGATVGFRNLNLAPGASMSINMTAATPPPSTSMCTTTSPCFWTDEAKQSNDFSGTGNDLNSDSNSSYGTVTSAVASCAKNGCSTTLGNGGNANSAPGSISTTVSTASAKTTVTQIEAIDFGTQLPASNCSGVSSQHMTFENLSNGGSDRSQTVTINTTHFPDYQSQVCLATTVPFTELVIVTNPDGSQSEFLQLTPPTTLPDGTPGFEGLLPDCGAGALHVNCKQTPGVVAGSRQTTVGIPPLQTTHSIAAQIPPGFDMWAGN